MASSSAGPHDAYLATSYFPSLDGCRCFSILGVLWLHSYLFSGYRPTGLLANGAMGVQLFFTISGFLITTLLLREQAKTGAISLRNFYIRRTLRIFPVYYLMLLFYVGLAFFVEKEPGPRAEFFKNLPAFATYTTNWFVHAEPGKRVIFSFSWSLATEEQFYLLWPWVVAFAPGLFARVGFIVAMIALGEGASFAVDAGWLDQASLVARILTSIATPIGLGCLAAHALHAKGTFDACYAVLGRAWSSTVAAVVLVALLSFKETPNQIIYVAMLLLVMSVCMRLDHGLRWLLDNRAVKYLGTISYGMYLTHMLAVNVARRVVPTSPFPRFLLALAVSIVIAGVMFRFFEQPILKLKTRFQAALAPRPATVNEVIAGS